MAKQKNVAGTGRKYHVAAAGNTEPPAYELIKEMGYDVTKEGGAWVAQDNQNIVSATGPLELLGLIALIRAKGENWRVSDDKIEAFIDFNQSGFTNSLKSFTTAYI